MVFMVYPLDRPRNGVYGVAIGHIMVFMLYPLDRPCSGVYGVSIGRST